VARVAVIGHVEWVLQARTRAPVASGEIIQLHDTYEEPGGGGGVTARALPSLGAETVFFTALGNDHAAAESERILRSEGCEVRAGRRQSPQNRVTTISDAAGERTIFIHGPNDSPLLEDALGWDEMGAFDGVFYTGDDARTLVAARASRVVVATARRLESVIASGVQVDVLAGSANDRGEHYDPMALPVRPRLCVWTDGARGGHYLAEDGSEGRWDAVAPPGPIADAYGAGDVFMAALTLALARAEGRDGALAWAARAAAAQLTRRGGRPT
jgi:sugar/nucleoside kinase (ribokinase family)